MRRYLEPLLRFDWTLLAAAITLSAVGIVTIYGISTSRDTIDLLPFYKQFAVTIIGLVLIFSAIFVDYRHLRSYAFLLYLFGALLLVSVLLFGQTVRSTQGWFRFGGLSFQPVEIAKITLVIYLSALFVRIGHHRLHWRAFGLSAGATMVYVVLTLLQPDFGSAMILLALWGVMILFAGLPRRAWLILPVTTLILGGLLWSFGLKEYQRQRIITFVHPQTDTRDSGYNATQARIAIGSGGLFGKGIGEGSQARLRFLPEAATDFMFAVIGEELGFMGVTVVLGLFCLILYRYLRIAYEAEDDFAALLLIGLAGIFLVHIIVNAGMNLGVMPITGIPLPFVSAGASYLFVAFLSIALVESVAIRRRKNAFG
ncbi:rod shape-determining protein RodA [Candidatus Uhrbacteria bacterium]|nr:rod shape-determining protein RodA [Candidatus Uhrbacteria bacterium]